MYAKDMDTLNQDLINKINSVLINYGITATTHISENARFSPTDAGWEMDDCTPHCIALRSKNAPLLSLVNKALNAHGVKTTNDGDGLLLPQTFQDLNKCETSTLLKNLQLLSNVFSGKTFGFRPLPEARATARNFRGPFLCVLERKVRFSADGAIPK